MTKNQIDYWNYVENSRHNLAMERNEARKQDEVNRSNMAQEAIAQQGNAIKRQQNIINQSHYERLDAESQRANLARERETNRANVAYETETNRHNVVNELYQGSSLANAREIASISAGVGYANVAETQRANMVREAETNRSNLVYESIAQLNAESQGRQAGAAVVNASTKAGELQFSRDKWSSIGLQQAQVQTWADQQDTRVKLAKLDSDLALARSQIASNYAKTAESGSRTLSNTVGLISKFIPGGKK